MHIDLSVIAKNMNNNIIVLLITSAVDYCYLLPHSLAVYCSELYIVWYCTKYVEQTVKDWKKKQKIPKITKIKNRGPLSVSQWDGRSIMCIHDIPSHVSVSNYQSTTMQYRTKMPSPFPRAVVNLFFNVRRVYTLKPRFMVIPRIL